MVSGTPAGEPLKSKIQINSIKIHIHSLLFFTPPPLTMSFDPVEFQRKLDEFRETLSHQDDC